MQSATEPSMGGGADDVPGRQGRSPNAEVRRASEAREAPAHVGDPYTTGRRGPQNGGVTTAPDAVTAPTRLGLDRPVLISNLLSGAMCLAPLAILSWPLLLIGGLYVVAGAVFLAAVYGRRPLTRRQELLAWLVPWLAAVALWSLLVGSIEFENNLSQYLLGMYAGVVVATPSYLVWQIVALGARQFMARRASKSPLPA